MTQILLVLGTNIFYPRLDRIPIGLINEQMFNSSHIVHSYWGFQNRGLRTSCKTLGQKEEPASNELRQAVQEYQAILQEGYHEEDRTKPKACVSVLSSILLVTMIALR